MKDLDARRLDVKRFAEEGGTLGAETPVRSFDRLHGETTPEGSDRRVTWKASGEQLNPKHVSPEVWLHLQAEATLPVVCQRCLNPVDIEVAIDRSFRFVADESAAAAQDDEAEEDVLALSRSFDLMELLEDEILMDLPLAPRHEVCPEPVKMSVSDPAFDAAEAARENPFAVLGLLKPGTSDKR